MLGCYCDVGCTLNKLKKLPVLDEATLTCHPLTVSACVLVIVKSKLTLKVHRLIFYSVGDLSDFM